jgi:hypothetical protein
VILKHHKRFEWPGTSQAVFQPSRLWWKKATACVEPYCTSGTSIFRSLFSGTPWPITKHMRHDTRYEVQIISKSTWLIDHTAWTNWHSRNEYLIVS